jgi:hypothetical protein
MEVTELNGVPGGIRTLVCAVKALHPAVTDRKLRHGSQPSEPKRTLGKSYRTLNEPIDAASLTAHIRNIKDYRATKLHPNLMIQQTSAPVRLRVG